MYTVLTKKQLETPTGKLKWKNKFETITDDEWTTIYKMPFIISKDTKLQWFQSRINHFILGTNSLLNKINPNFDNKCQFCKTDEETIEHIFWNCTKTQELLISLETKLDSLSINLSYNKATFLFGLFNSKKIHIAHNLFILWLKFYIYKTKQEEGVLNLNSALNHLKTYYQYSRAAFIYNNDQDKFENNWKQYSNLFNQ